jgi:hypothetical protein
MFEMDNFFGHRTTTAKFLNNFKMNDTSIIDSEGVEPTEKSALVLPITVEFS